MRDPCTLSTFLRQYGEPVVLEPHECREGGRLRAAFIDALRSNRLWSVIESDEGDEWYAVSGNHVVNRLVYLVTIEPHDGGHHEWCIDGLPCGVAHA